VQWSGLSMFMGGGLLHPGIAILTQESDDDDDDEDDDDDPDVAIVGQILHESGHEEEPLIVAALLNSNGPEFVGLAQFWSRGTRCHAQGKCKPCPHIRTPSGCAYGKACTCCHLVHVDSHRPGFRRVLEDAFTDYPERFMTAMRAASQNNNRIRSLVDAWFAQLAAKPPLPPPIIVHVSDSDSPPHPSPPPFILSL